MKLYLWDKAALDFSKIFKAFGRTAKVILVTTLNPKRFGGLYINFCLLFKKIHRMVNDSYLVSLALRNRTAIDWICSLTALSICKVCEELGVE